MSKTKCVDTSQVERLDVHFKVYAVRDSNGNFDSSVCDEPGDTIQICGMQDAEGNAIYFESEAYHLKGWCEEYSLNYSCSDGIYTIEI